MKKLILILMLFPVNTFAQDKWDNIDKGLFGAFIFLEIIDYGQTTYIFDNPNYYERNSIIRKADESFGQAGILLYFTSAIIGSYFLADKLSSKNRKLFLSAIDLFQIKTVNDNFSVGIKIKF